MALTEQRILNQVTILPNANSINVQWANQVLRDGNVLSETFERKAYSVAEQLSEFSAEVGTIDLNEFLTKFNVATLDEKAAAVADLAAAQAQVTQLQADLAAAQAQIPAPSTSTAGTVTMRQARLALLHAGKYHEVDAAINALEEPTKSAAKIEWEYASTVERSSQFFTLLGAALGLDDAALDELFAFAATV
jgi:hypothetical protein